MSNHAIISGSYFRSNDSQRAGQVSGQNRDPHKPKKSYHKFVPVEQSADAEEEEESSACNSQRKRPEGDRYDLRAMFGNYSWTVYDQFQCAVARTLHH